MTTTTSLSKLSSVSNATKAHDIDTYLHAGVVNQINQGKTTIYFKGATLLRVKRVRHLTLLAKADPTT